MLWRYDAATDDMRWYSADEAAMTAAVDAAFREMKVAADKHKAAREAYLEKYKPEVLAREAGASLLTSPTTDGVR